MKQCRQNGKKIRQVSDPYANHKKRLSTYGIKRHRYKYTLNSRVRSKKTEFCATIINEVELNIATATNQLPIPAKFTNIA